MRRRLILAASVVTVAIGLIAVPTTSTTHHTQQAGQCVGVGIGGGDPWAYACTP